MSTDGDRCPICGDEYDGTHHQCFTKRRDREWSRTLWVAAAIAALILGFCAAIVWSVLAGDEL